MPYLWTIGSRYPNSAWGIVESRYAEEQHIFMQGRPIAVNSETIVYSFRKIGERTVRRLGWLTTSTGGAPLVGPEIKKILEVRAPEDCQFINTIVSTKDESITDFYILNIVATAPMLDFSRCNSRTFTDGRIMGIEGPVFFLPNCMGRHAIARDVTVMSSIVVSDDLAVKLLETSLPGVGLVAEGQSEC